MTISDMKASLEKLKEGGYETYIDYFPEDDDCEFNLIAPDGQRFTGETKDIVIANAHQYYQERQKLQLYEEMMVLIQKVAALEPIALVDMSVLEKYTLLSMLKEEASALLLTTEILQSHSN